MSTRGTVEELLSRMASGGAEKTAELFAEEVDFMCAGSEKVPWIRPRRTRRDLADFFGSMNASFVPEDRSASASAFLVDGDDAVVLGIRFAEAQVQWQGLYDPVRAAPDRLRWSDQPLSRLRGQPDDHRGRHGLMRERKQRCPGAKPPAPLPTQSLGNRLPTLVRRGRRLLTLLHHRLPPGSGSSGLRARHLRRRGRSGRRSWTDPRAEGETPCLHSLSEQLER